MRSDEKRNKLTREWSGEKCKEVTVACMYACIPNTSNMLCVSHEPSAAESSPTW